MMNSASGDSESGDSTSSTPCEEKTIIDKILGEMKCEFNKGDKKPEDLEEDKPRLILSFKKPSQETPPSAGGRKVRTKSNPQEEEMVLKRSARRRSKDCESVLQSAIARKEKSYNESQKPQRLSRQLKPTQKILENLALAKQEKTKFKVKKPEDSSPEPDQSRKHKHRHYHNPKRAKKPKLNEDSSKESDSDLSTQDENSLKSGEVDDARERSPHENLPNGVGEQPIVARFCLCTQKTRYYLAKNREDAIYCGAADSISGKVVGCSRNIETKDVMMMRASTRMPYTVMCDAHRNRLLRHNCCPVCGVFCTQGKFVECASKHHYHRKCLADEEGCPHCGEATPSGDVEIRIQSDKKPIFLPVQKAQYVSARITFPSTYKQEDGRLTPSLLPVGALDMQNSLEYGDDEYEFEDLASAVKTNSLEKVAIILGSKSVVLSTKIPEFNEGTVLHYAAQKGYLSVVHMLLVGGLQPDIFDKDQNTPLMLAVVASNNDVVHYLVRAGARIDLKGTDGMTALHLAAKCGNIKACDILLKAAKTIKNFVNGQDDGGWTPLVWACEHGYADVVNYLIYKGADANVRDVEHNVALHWAAFSGSSHIAQLLLNKGCDVNAVNAHGDTPLHIGARQDMYDCIIVLLARGADVTLLNKNKESALDCVPPGGDSYNPISLNITLQASSDCGFSSVILSNDISKGKEANPIQCYNNLDSDEKPADFRYITKNCITSDDIRIDSKISSLQCCQCEERCVEEECTCGKMSVRCWYDEEGKLIPEFSFSDIPMIFECNDRCSCNYITCNNRVVQKGLTHRFEMFKTPDKGWGVRTLRLIPKGSFVCEYVGEIITDADAERRDDDSFLFDLENRVCRSETDLDAFCIDAKFYGNFTRFINHSCDPNLTSVKVFIEHQDLRFPRIAFFANRDIQGDEELSFDYGEKFWVAKYKSFSCYCGSVDCKYSEETIESTLRNHQRKMDECG